MSLTSEGSSCDACGTLHNDPVAHFLAEHPSLPVPPGPVIQWAYGDSRRCSSCYRFRPGQPILRDLSVSLRVRVDFRSTLGFCWEFIRRSPDQSFRCPWCTRCDEDGITFKVRVFFCFPAPMFFLLEELTCRFVFFPLSLVLFRGTWSVALSFTLRYGRGFPTGETDEQLSIVSSPPL